MEKRKEKEGGEGDIQRKRGEMGEREREEVEGDW